MMIPDWIRLRVTPEKLECGMIASIVAYFCPVQMLVYGLFGFVAVDFVTGCMADYKRKHEAHKRWAFSSDKMWRTIFKLTFGVVGIAMSHWVDQEILSSFTSINLAKIFTGYLCGAEFWSWVENAAFICKWPLLEGVRKSIIHTVDEKLGISIEDVINEDKNNEKDKNRQ